MKIELAPRHISQLDQCKAEDQAKLKWLRGAVQESIDSLDRGEGETFASIDDLAEHNREIGQKLRSQ